METIVKNKGILMKEKIARFFAKWPIFPRGKNKKGNSIEASHFYHYVAELESDDLMYVPLVNAMLLCDEGLSVCRKRLRIIGQLQEVSKDMKKLEAFNQLTDEEGVFIKGLLIRFNSQRREKSALLGQLVAFDEKTGHMAEHEREATDELPDIQYAEKMQRAFKQDLGLLAGERVDLLYERGTLQRGLMYVNRFALGLSMVILVFLGVLAYIYFVRQTNPLLPLMVMSGASAVILLALVTIKRKMEEDIFINGKKQMKTTDLLNKKTVIYAYYTNYLNYEYKKFAVRSASMLENHLKEVERYKHVTMRLDSIRSILNQTEQEITKFLMEKDIYKATGFDTFARDLDIDNKRSFYAEKSTQQKRLDRELKILDTRHSHIWEELSDLAALDSTETGIIDRMIHGYLDETRKIITSFKLEKEVVELDKTA